MGTGFKRAVISSLVVAGAVIPAAFQGCGIVSFSPLASNNLAQSRGGEGFDGKVYWSYGPCGSTVGVSTIIKTDSASASVLAIVTRENCQDLPAPQIIPVSELKYSSQDPSVFSREGRVFDRQVSSPAQKVTLAFCEESGAGTQSLVWGTVGGSGDIFGKVMLGDGSTTGDLKLINPQTIPPRYLAANGQQNQFDLALASLTSGSLNYSIAGGPLISLPVVTCASQQPAPVPSAFPDASNTGVPAGVTLTASGGFSINTPGAVIDALDINGQVTISASNVTLKRSRIRSGAWTVIYIDPSATGVRIEDCEIDGRGAAGFKDSQGITGPATILRSNIHSVASAIVSSGDMLSIQDCFIHDLQASASTVSFHGIRLDGGASGVTIRHNTIVNQMGATAAIMIDNFFGPISNIVVDENRLSGGDFTVYSDAQFSGGPISGVQFTNNRLGSGQFGYTLIRGNTAVWQGNVDDVTGLLIP